MNQLVEMSAEKLNAQPHRKAIQGLLLATLFWGISFPTMRALSKIQSMVIPDLNSWTFTAIIVVARFSIAALIVAIFNWKEIRKLGRSELEQGLGLGFFGSIGIVFQMDALYYTDASISAFLTQCYCIWIPFFVHLRMRKAPKMELVLSTLLVILGIATLSNFDPQNLHFGRGEVETIIASLFFAAQILWLERPKFKDNRTGPSTFAMFVTMALTSLPIALYGDGQLAKSWELLLQPDTLALLGILAIFCTLSPFLLMNYWQRKVSATEAGLIYCIEPIFAAIFAGFLPEIFAAFSKIDYPNESPTVRILIGGALITCANLLLQFAGNWRKRRLLLN